METIESMLMRIEELEIRVSKLEAKGKRKGKEKDEFVAPTIEEFIEHGREICLEKKYLFDREWITVKFIDWESNDWHDAYNHKITNWKNKLRTNLWFLNRDKNGQANSNKTKQYAAYDNSLWKADEKFAERISERFGG